MATCRNPCNPLIHLLLFQKSLIVISVDGGNLSLSWIPIDVRDCLLFRSNSRHVTMLPLHGAMIRLDDVAIFHSLNTKPDKSVAEFAAYSNHQQCQLVNGGRPLPASWSPVGQGGGQNPRFAHSWVGSLGAMGSYAVNNP